MVTHSLTGTTSMGEKHGGERAHRLWPTLCFTHAFAMAQQRCSIPRSLDGDICRCLCCKITEIDSQDLAKSLANIIHTLSVNHRPNFQWTAHSSGHLPLHRVTVCLHLSSHTFPGSASPLLLILTGCPSLDKALASFDAFLLESRVVCCKKDVRFWMSRHLNVTTLDRERVGKEVQPGSESLKLCL